MNTSDRRSWAGRSLDYGTAQLPNVQAAVVRIGYEEWDDDRKRTDTTLAFMLAGDRRTPTGQMEDGTIYVYAASGVAVKVLRLEDSVELATVDVAPQPAATQETNT